MYETRISVHGLYFQGGIEASIVDLCGVTYCALDFCSYHTCTALELKLFA